jgi:hypothetical protein
MLIAGNYPCEPTIKRKHFFNSYLLLFRTQSSRIRLPEIQAGMQLLFDHSLYPLSFSFVAATVSHCIFEERRPGRR